MAGSVLNGGEGEVTDPPTNGEVKQPPEGTVDPTPEPVDPEPEPEPAPEPTLVIDSAVQEDDGSVIVSGTSTELPKGTTVTVTLGDLITIETATDKKGRWSVTVPTAEAEVLPAGTVTVAATAATASDTDSLVVAEPEPGYVILNLPPGYSLPLEFTPTEETVLSEIERSIMFPDGLFDWDATAPQQYTTNRPADAISLLPYKDREEVYDLFIASVDLPFFAEAAENVKEVNVNLIILGIEAKMTGNWDSYDRYKERAEDEWGYRGLLALDYLVDIYFEEHPEEMFLKGKPHSMYWIILEWYRLRLENPKLSDSILRSKRAHPVPLPNIQKLLELFRESVQKGYVFGLDNPWQ